MSELLTERLSRIGEPVKRQKKSRLGGGDFSKMSDTFKNIPQDPKASSSIIIVRWFFVALIRKSFGFRGISVQKIDGGYILVSQRTLAHLSGQISSRAVSAIEGRGIIGLQEMRSIRAGAGALRAKSRRGVVIVPNYRATELSKLANISIRAASKSLKTALEYNFGPKRGHKLIAIPRRVIRFLAKCERRSVLLVLLTYIERGLSIDNGRIKSAGTAKASLIAERTGLTIRSVRLARAKLLKLGLITPDSTKYQRKLNKDGAYFTINLSWAESKKGRYADKKHPTDPRLPSSQISPPRVKNDAEISPPYRNKISSKESRNQETQSNALKFAGFSGERVSIRNVREQDLRNIKLCEALYIDACSRGLGDKSEMGAINFLASVCRARDIAEKEQRPHDAPRLFMGILKARRWNHINQVQEERARGAIAKRREQDPYFFRFDKPVNQHVNERGTICVDTLIRKCSTGLTC